MMTAEKTFKVEDINGDRHQITLDLIAAAGFKVANPDVFNLEIDGKINVYLEGVKRYDWHDKFIATKGVALTFRNEASGYRTVRRYVSAKDEQIDLAKFKAKVDELLKLYEECDRALAVREQEQAEKDAAKNQIRQRCTDLGLDSQINGVGRFSLKVGSDSVSLEIQYLSPEMAKKVIELVKAGEQ